MIQQARLPLVLTFQAPIICVTSDGSCYYHATNYAISNGEMEMTEATANELRTRLIEYYRSKSRFKEAERLSLKGSAGYPGPTDILAMCDVLQMSIALNISFLDGRCTKRMIEIFRPELGEVQMTIIYRQSIDGAETKQSSTFRS